MNSEHPDLNAAARVAGALMAELSKTIVGQEEIVRGLIASLFANGHCLLIGVPGLAKTLLVQSIARVMGVDFKRIQFTPDLMPADILGSEMIHEHQGRMEAMQERRVTIAGENRVLPEPFLVVATQNPIEHEGTYPLPEAQLDRFMFSLDLGYPNRDHEIEIVRRTTIGESATLATVVSGTDILAVQQLVRAMPVAAHILAHAVDLTAATRPNHPGGGTTAANYIEWGAGPRASQYLILGAKALALMDGRAAPEAADVRRVAPYVLSHRIVPNYRATGDGLKARELVAALIKEVPEPTY
jgi:MoxR-like ATPase